MSNYTKTLAAVTLAASAAFAQAQEPQAGCNNQAPTAQKQDPGFWDKAASIGGKIAGDVAGGVVRDATRGLGNQAGRAVREAYGDFGKYTGEAQRQARGTVNQASREATNAAKNGTRGAVNSAKGAFEDCSTPRTAPQNAPAPAPAPAPAEAASAPANNNASDPGQQNLEALKGVGNAVGGWLKKVPGL